jgi:hypothetical protein
MKKKKSLKLRGNVQRIIEPILPNQPEKAEIQVEEADDLYRELRIENKLTDGDGGKSRLKKGEEVDVTIEAEVDSSKQESRTA